MNGSSFHTLGVLHDLALLYLSLAYGVDGRPRSDGQRTVAAKLRQWRPDHDPALIDHVTRDALLSYLSLPDNEAVYVLAKKLAKALPLSIRESVLRDLNGELSTDARLAVANGVSLSGIAAIWNA